jgi:tetratricopeptide (TPR) repeat protein
LISVIGFLSAGIIVGQYIKYSPARKVFTVSKGIHFNLRSLILLILIVYMATSVNVFSRNNEAREFFNSHLSNSKISLNLIDLWQDPKIIELIGNELLNNFDDCSDIELASNALIAQSVRSHQAWYFKALCSSYAQDYLRALEFLNRALVLDPLNTNYLSSKGKLELFLKMFEEARLTIDLIKSIDPKEKEIPNLERLLSNFAK